MKKNKQNLRRIFPTFGKIFPLSELPTIAREYLSDIIKTNKKIEYINHPCAFDIETSSFYENGEKRAIMYEWTLGLNGAVFISRTWEEFENALSTLAEVLGLTKERRLVIYVHNLAFEFQFMRKWFSWESVFAVKERKPVYARSLDGIEFRCSYILSGYGLASLGKQLRKYHVKKSVGDLDYKLLRHSETPLTENEVGYCVNDVLVVMAYIEERIEADGDISRIPLTKTGYVRKYCRDACMYDGSHKKNSWKYLNYRRLMNQLTIDSAEYEQLKRAFQGGFTHANAYYAGEIMHNVASYDFTSSYPAVMVSERFPMSHAEIIQPKNEQEFRNNLVLYCCLFDIEFIDIEGITTFEHPLSKSRCKACEGVTEDNGRIVEAHRIQTTLTEQDFFILEKFYKWRKMRVGTFRRYKKGYLPTDFIKSILKLYSDKTTLKGIQDREEDYLRSKEMINSCYGMCVTDICRDENIYSGSNWTLEPVKIDEAIQKNNESKRRFLFFPWGVWVTAYARRNLFSGIYEFKNDYVYSDTDSVKVLNHEKHLKYIESYNKRITEKLETALKYHKIPLESIRPKTIQGKEKPLGVWDFEGIYTRLKTLGAKRYLVEKKNALIVDDKSFDISLTVSGVNKTHAIPYLYENFGKDGTFERFKEDLYIPPEYTGKMTHTYIDDEHAGQVTDYTGKTGKYCELSSVHLENADYSLSLADAYVDYLLGIREYTK